MVFCLYDFCHVILALGLNLKLKTAPRRNLGYLIVSPIMPLVCSLYTPYYHDLYAYILARTVFSVRILTDQRLSAPEELPR